MKQIDQFLQANSFSILSNVLHELYQCNQSMIMMLTKEMCQSQYTHNSKGIVSMKVHKTFTYRMLVIERIFT